jgi:uncharacterized delta-60 repeat protein
MFVAKLKNDGEPSERFGSEGVFKVPFPDPAGDRWVFGWAGAVQPDGSLVATGGTRFYSERTGSLSKPAAFAVARITSGGNLDPSFSRDGRQLVRLDRKIADAYGVAIANDGSVIIGGSAGSANQDNFMSVARLASNGRLDADFGDGGTAFLSTLSDGYTTSLDEMGRILVAGGAGFIDGPRDSLIARFLP